MKRCRSAVWLAGLTFRFTAALNNGGNYIFISIAVIAHGRRMEYLLNRGLNHLETSDYAEKRFLKSEKREKERNSTVIRYRRIENFC